MKKQIKDYGFLLLVALTTYICTVVFNGFLAIVFLLFLILPLCLRSAEKQDWISVEKKMPPNDKMVLIKTINEPIVKYAVAIYDEDLECFVDYEDSELAASHWKYLD